MPLVGRPKLAKALPKALPHTAAEALLETVAQDRHLKRRTDWAERDLAIILTALLAGLRADELRRANVGDIRTTDDGARSFTSQAKAARNAAYPSRPTSTAVPSASPLCAASMPVSSSVADVPPDRRVEFQDISRQLGT